MATGWDKASYTPNRGRELVAELIAQNRRLAARVSVLELAERRLSTARARSRQQPTRVSALSDFALSSSALRNDTAILSEGVSLLDALFYVDVLSVVRVAERGSSLDYYTFASGEDMATTSWLVTEVSEPVDDAPCASYWKARRHAETLLASAAAGNPEVWPMIEAAIPSHVRDAQQVPVTVVVVPLHRSPTELFGAIVAARRHDSDGSLFKEPLDDSHRPFLQLVGNHVETALNRVRIFEDLQSRSIELTAKNRELKTSIEQMGKMEAIGLLAGGVAHDFNNLLTVILGGADHAKTLLGGAGMDTDDVDLIIDAGDRATKLTRQLLAFSRLQEFRLEVFDVNDVVANLGGMLSRLIGEDIQFTLSLDDRELAIRADRSQIEQMLMNLVVNAREATPSGGTIEIATDVVEHTPPGCPLPPPLTMLRVSDNGHGMDERTKARCFEPFFTTRAVGSGTGMGLATVYGIVEQTGGHLALDSHAGHGTTFWIYFRREQSAPTPTREAETEPPEIGAGTILLAEDEPGIRKLASRVLNRRGFEVLIAADGEQALALANAHQGSIDLLITDVVMPKIGGNELAEELATHRPGLKVLYISGYRGNKVSDRVVVNEANYLEKPFSPDHLMRKVAKLLADTGDDDGS